MEPPFLLPVLVGHGASDWRNGLWDFVPGERCYVIVRQHAVVDPQLVDVAAAVVVVGALDSGGRDDAGVGAELVERGVEHSGRGLLAGELAVDVEADSGRFVPGQREVNPLVRLGEVGHRVGDAGSSEVDVGDKGVEAVAVVVDAEPDHVPTGVIAVADAKDGELGLVDGLARAPVERERSALGVDISRRPIGQELVVAALQV